MKHCRCVACVLMALVLCCPITAFAATQGEANALRSADSYLEFMGFSYNGLIAQLEYDQYTHEEAVYAADNCGADWNENAVKSAKNYLEFMGFSYNGLIEQLEYDQYTHEEAVYAADHCGADWNENAVKSAKNYLETMGFSYNGLIEQLEYDQYTHEEAVYAADVTFNGDAAASTPEPTAAPTQAATEPPAEMPAAADVANTPVIYQALQRGDRGDEVVKLQRALVALGYLSGAADGIFGGATEAAVEAFQKAKGLQVTRVADNPTLQILYASISIDDSITYNDYDSSQANASDSEAAAEMAPVSTPEAKPTAKPTAQPTQKPKTSSSSSGSSSLLSESDCKDLARFYLNSMVGSATIQLIDATSDGNHCLVAIQYSVGGSTKISGFMIDRRDGSLEYVQ